MVGLATTTQGSIAAHERKLLMPPIRVQLKKSYIQNRTVPLGKWLAKKLNLKPDKRYSVKIKGLEQEPLTCTFYGGALGGLTVLYDNFDLEESDYIDITCDGSAIHLIPPPEKRRTTGQPPLPSQIPLAGPPIGVTTNREPFTVNAHEHEVHEGTGCCGDIFSVFNFKQIRLAKPPKRKGAYVIRIVRRGEPTDRIVPQCRAIVDGIGWSIVDRYVIRRVNRLNQITDCPLIYIGRAGKSEDSQNTLWGRYGQLAHTHTVMFPVWALLFFGWELEYGWIEHPNPEDAEESLKERYRSRHDGRLPALVER